MTLLTPIAFSPGSVTCFFSPELNESPQETRSRGISINLVRGVTAAIRSTAASRIRLNGNDIDIAPVRTVIARLAPEPVELQFESALSLGCGFGVSAGCVLTAAFAIAKHFDLAMSRDELGLVAHAAEVAHRTGLGDVAAQLCGGIAHRHCREGPLDCIQLTLPAQQIFFRVFSKVDTPEVLNSGDMLNLIRKEGDAALAWVDAQQETLTVSGLLDRSLAFARRTRLLASEATASAIQDIVDAGGSATMAMLGNSIVATRPGSKEDDWDSCLPDSLGTRLL